MGECHNVRIVVFDDRVRSKTITNQEELVELLDVCCVGEELEHGNRPDIEKIHNFDNRDTSDIDPLQRDKDTRAKIIEAPSIDMMMYIKHSANLVDLCVTANVTYLYTALLHIVHNLSAQFVTSILRSILVREPDQRRQNDRQQSGNNQKRIGTSKTRETQSLVPKPTKKLLQYYCKEE
uniref:Uncharacterized protein n=1 Tax=Pristionchus pacificus TaxID=54126 RepID=A0A2A6CVS8_PRIPA|eukprot:PDM82269.1 hypothetical protein PRIPAC_36662 [Pristionchus pacificus]